MIEEDFGGYIENMSISSEMKGSPSDGLNVKDHVIAIGNEIKDFESKLFTAYNVVRLLEGCYEGYFKRGEGG